jgi:hypothetical protein
MNFPSIPTDNLYKFLAISGVALLITGIYFRYNFENEVNAELSRLQLSEAIINLKTKSDATYSQKLDSLTLAHDIKGLRNSIEKLPENYKSAILLLLSGAALAAFGFIQWHLKLQRFSDKIIENEARKIIEQKSVITHQIRFEKEYLLYERTWGPLGELKQSLNILVFNIKMYQQGKPENKDDLKEAVDESFNKSHKHYSELFLVIERNAPFYPKKIHQKLLEIRKIGSSVYEEAVNLEFLQNYRELGYKLESHLDKFEGELPDAIEALVILIQKRIELTEVQE